MAGRSLLAYPAVGLLIGVLLAVVHGLSDAAPPAVSAALILLTWVLSTGALHLDGLADCADAWVGGHGSRERTLQILKDPHAGSVAVAVTVTVLLAKFAALQSLPAQSGAVETL
ncbi:adenosylcobinamide-GDP ribazoletransferase, partial [Methylogaea oryzae]|uniref:adenosylcobinamide-GDP ribazoletransferase n=1 Tax=Methylogaea oryzae TaxID=1295382 RepID=UPI000A61876A